MKLTSFAWAVVSLGTMAAVLCAAPDETQKDPFADPAAAKVDHDSSLGADFVNFCRENPSAPAPVGEKPLYFEYFIGDFEGDKVPANLPAAELLAQGKGEWGYVEVRTNSSAEGGSAYTLERSPDGRLLDAREREEIGTIIYVHLAPSGKDTVIQLRRTGLNGWTSLSNGLIVPVQPIFERYWVTTKLTLDSQWHPLGRIVQLPAGGQRRTYRLVSVAVRLLLEKPAAAPQTVPVSLSLQQGISSNPPTFPASLSLLPR